jgi:hypothetical protein
MSDLIGCKNSSFRYLKKKLQATWSRIFLGNFQKESPHFEEESYKLIKTFEGFEQVFILLLNFSYLANRF